MKKGKEEKITVKDEVQVKDILLLGEDIDKRLVNVHKYTEEAISASTMIRLELEKQIEGLDAIYDENMDTRKKIKRAQKGLKQILKRAMLNKITRCLMVLVLLAVIGLITVSILKDKGIIKIPQ